MSRVQPWQLLEAAMKPFTAMFMAIFTICALAACESAGNQYDGVSRFAADRPYYGPGSAPHEAPPAPEVPGEGPNASI